MMGEPITVIEKETSRPGYIRFETNRSFTGMGHEQYKVGETIYGDRPPDEIAKSLFASDKVEEVHIYGQMITVKLLDGASSSGLAAVIEDHYIFYGPGISVPTADSFT